MVQVNSERNKIILGLQRIKSFLGFINNPQHSFKSVIIGGTNGKGSVTFFLSNLACKLTKYNVGRYISPHLVSFKERFIVNENKIEDVQFYQAYSFIQEKVCEFEKLNKDSDRLTEFEIYTALAFYLFVKNNVELAFLEIGLGGRLDAVNVVDSDKVLCSVITNVSFDHMDYLGHTLEEIAFEKSGIIKENNWLVTGCDEHSMPVLSKVAGSLNAKIKQVPQDSKLDYKANNIEIVLAVWETISPCLDVLLDYKDKKNFLCQLQFPGRFQYIKDKKILLDGAHNPAGAHELRKMLDLKFPNSKISYIVGFLDKDYKQCLNYLIRNNDVICVEPNSERATKKEEIAKAVLEFNGRPYLANNLIEAIELSRNFTSDLTVITGSLYLVGEAIEFLGLN